jgi:hydrogenase/urease accessory protein HupE
VFKRRVIFLLFAMLTLALGFSKAHADDIRLAYLQLTEIEPDIYQVLWKVPARGQNERLSLSVMFDEQVKTLQEPVAGFIGNAHLQRWTMARTGGLTGTTIGFNGMASASMEVLLQIDTLDGATFIHRVTPDAPTYMVAAQPGLLQVVATYLVLGIEHILIGIDHLLFVLVLLMLVRSTRKLVLTITAFTIAHSITLSLAALNLIHVPVPPVEACIALSIVFVVTEVIHSKRGTPGLTEQRPWLVAFIFGLLHGLGFAAALGEIGLPQTAVPAALLFFNIGVEVGQLLFVGIVLSLWWALRHLSITVPLWVRMAPSYAIGSVASFWVFERVAGFWG